MKEPDPPDDLEQTILETFDELHAEAKIVPMVLLFPPEVIECIKTYYPITICLIDFRGCLRS